MAGTRQGGLMAAKTIKEVNPTFYKKDLPRARAERGAYTQKGGFASEKLGKDGLEGRERATILAVKAGKRSAELRHYRKSLLAKIQQYIADMIKAYKTNRINEKELLELLENLTNPDLLNNVDTEFTFKPGRKHK